MIHNFGSRYARKPIKGSKDSDDSLVSKKNWSEKIGSLDWHLGPGEVAKNTPLVTPPQENPKPKKIFSVETGRLAESADGLNTSLALTTGELWNYKSLNK